MADGRSRWSAATYCAFWSHKYENALLQIEGATETPAEEDAVGIARKRAPRKFLKLDIS